jgi:hypothetical protein
MFRTLAKLALGVFATAILVGVSNASAEVPLKQKAGGTILSVVPGSLTFAAQGKATYFGSYSTTGGANFDLLGNVFGGQLLTTTADGATIQGSISGTYAPLSSGQIQFNLQVTWYSGTGRLAGVTGQADVLAIAEGVAPGAAFQELAFGTLVLP